MSLARNLADLGSSATSLDTVGSNLVANGSCIIAQRGTSSTTNGYGSVDRFQTLYSGTDEAPTQAQVDVASGTTPYTLGFRKALKITNGNQTSGAGAADYLGIYYRIEGQDISSSGWNTTDSNSKLTLSYWVKSSVAQTFYGRFRAFASSEYEYTYSFALSADTWTKVTKTISGNSNFSSLVNTNAVGFFHNWQCFFGTDYTNNKTLDEWAVKDNANKSPDMTSTWYTTNDATFEITGVQLQAGEATDFEHEPYSVTLAKAKRYFEVYAPVTNDDGSLNVWRTRTSVNNYNGVVHFLEKRTQPTCTIDYDRLHKPGVAKDTLSNISVTIGSGQTQSCTVNSTPTNDSTISTSAFLGKNSGTGKLTLDAEL